MEVCNYDVQMKTLRVMAHGCAITVSFETDPAETSVWHYIFSALSCAKETDVQPVDLPLK